MTVALGGGVCMCVNTVALSGGVCMCVYLETSQGRISLVAVHDHIGGDL